jgi:hypothetical protein
MTRERSIVHEHWICVYGSMGGVTLLTCDSSFTTVVPKVRVTGSSSADSIIM